MDLWMSTWVFNNINFIPETEAKGPNVNLRFETRESFNGEYTRDIN